LHIGRRAGDHTEDFAGGRLLFQGFGNLPIALEMGLELTEPVAAAMEVAMAGVAGELRSWGYELRQEG
jgi:hypothetical protein